MNYSTKYEEELIKISKELEKIDTIDKIGELAKEKAIILIRESLERLDEKLFKDKRRKNEYETKGKVESSNRFLSWLMPYNHRFKDEKELIEIIEKINIAVNNTVNQTTNIRL